MCIDSCDLATLLRSAFFSNSKSTWHPCYQLSGSTSVNTPRKIEHITSALFGRTASQCSI
jgi:hypothetical protein